MELETLSTVMNVLMIIAGCTCLVMGVLGLVGRRTPVGDDPYAIVKMHYRRLRLPYWLLVVLGPISLVFGIVFLAQ